MSVHSFAGEIPFIRQAKCVWLVKFFRGNDHENFSRLVLPLPSHAIARNPSPALST